jgi:hypothetical protein
MKNRGYAPELALGRRGEWQLRDLLRHENLLLILLDDVLILGLVGNHDLC